MLTAARCHLKTWGREILFLKVRGILVAAWEERSVCPQLCSSQGSRSKWAQPQFSPEGRLGNIFPVLSICNTPVVSQGLNQLHYHGNFTSLLFCTMGGPGDMSYMSPNTLTDCPQSVNLVLKFTCDRASMEPTWKNYIVTYGVSLHSVGGGSSESCELPGEASMCWTCSINRTVICEIWRPGQSLPSSPADAMSGFTLFDTVFGWTSWVTEHPHQCQDVLSGFTWRH